MRTRIILPLLVSTLASCRGTAPHRGDVAAPSKPPEPAACVAAESPGAREASSYFTCLVSWLDAADTYLRGGGEATRRTSAQTVAENRKIAREVAQSLELWLEQDFGNNAVKVRGYLDPETRKGVAQTRYLSGLSFYERGKFASAKGNWLDALRFDPDHADAKERLARLEREHPGL